MRMILRATALLLGALVFAGCASAPKAAPDSAPKAVAAEKQVHLVGTVFLFQFTEKNRMKETSPGIFELVMDTPAPSTESWMADKGAFHAIKFVLDKDWKKGYIGEGFQGPMVLDTGMANIYLNLVQGTKYLYKVDLNAMTYSVTVAP